ncbi:MAG: hypothetical protein PHV59_07690 [Victivallales bacterium]|nr:hypothetical protein [Victivallales bacterium]
MKNKLLLSGIMFSLCCLLQPMLTAEDTASKELASAAEISKVVTGVLTVNKDEDDAVISAVVSEGDTVYQIVLDENGKKLIREMADKQVAVTGIVTRKEVNVEDDDGNTRKQTELWLTVKSFKAVEESSSDE